ncbi:MAG TPA: hypothetical protein VK157_06500 [Phycisphaerales bacterium]|nr:hypothetical protein [Phycisphaerales bacterium]
MIAQATASALPGTSASIRRYIEVQQVRQISLPARLDTVEAIRFAQSLAAIAPEEKCTLDIRHEPWADPLGMLLVASAIRRFRTARLAAGTHCAILGKVTENSYLSWMGFYDAAGISGGKPTGHTHGKRKYLPITCIQFRELNNEAGASIHEQIYERSKRLAAILLQTGTRETKETLAIGYALREILRNVYEHSGAAKAYLVAQAWDSGIVEIAILDEGIGILKSLARNATHRAYTDASAIILATAEGVTGATSKSPDIADMAAWESQSYGVDPSRWENTGYGLYVLRKVSESAGSLHICSGDACVTFTDEPPSVAMSFHRGTAIGLRVSAARAAERLEETMKSLPESVRLRGSGSTRL